MVTVGQWRRAMVAGIAFVVLFVVGVLTAFSNSPEIKKKDTQATAAAKYVKYLSHGGHRHALVLSAYLLVLAALALIWFTSSLHRLLADDIAGAAVAGLGVLAAACMAIGSLIYASIGGAISIGNEPVPSGDTARVVMDTFIPIMLVGVGLSLAALIAFLAIGLRRARSVPSWVAYLGWLGVLGGIGAIEFIPLALCMLWFLLLAIIGLVRGPGKPVTRATAVVPGAEIA